MNELPVIRFYNLRSRKQGMKNFHKGRFSDARLPVRVFHYSHLRQSYKPVIDRETWVGIIRSATAIAVIYWNGRPAYRPARISCSPERNPVSELSCRHGYSQQVWSSDLLSNPGAISLYEISILMWLLPACDFCLIHQHNRIPLYFRVYDSISFLTIMHVL